MTVQRVEKLQGHAEALLDRYIGLRLRLALLEPLLGDTDARAFWSRGDRVHGFETLRITLFRSCALEVANLVSDKHETTPSLYNLTQGLADPDVRRRLREQYSAPNYVPDDPELADVRNFLIEREEARSRCDSEQFDEMVLALQRSYTELAQSEVIDCFGTLRDKSIAHAEVVHGDDGYSLFDVADLGLEWSDLAPTVHALERPVQLATGVFRGAEFAFEMLGRQHARMADPFWCPPQEG